MKPTIAAITPAMYFISIITQYFLQILTLVLITPCVKYLRFTHEMIIIRLWYLR